MTTTNDRLAYEWASREQGFAGTYEEFVALPAAEREEYEAGAAGGSIPDDSDDALVCGCRVQYDNSGVGHNYRNIDSWDIPANIREEIEGEIIDGKKDTCSDFVGSNGCHYRW